MPVLSFDIGGMSTKIAIMEKDQSIIFKDFIIYKNLIEIKELIIKIKEKIIKILTKFKITDITIATCGVVDNDTNISGLSAITNYSGTNWKEVLKEFKLPIYVENDAKSAALAELKYGNAIGVKNAAVLVVGTGIGGAVIIDNKLYKGSHLLAGEFGCMLDHLDNNGNYVNFSIMASTRSVSNRYHNLALCQKSTKIIFNDYYNDPIAKKAIDEMIFNLSKLIINISFTYDPELFLIGGAISENKLFFQLLNESVKKLLNLTDLAVNFQIKSCKFNNDANLIGAFSLSQLK